ncbi:MAG: polyphosphate polymerase domain-containing protein [Lachnospiraceae bacterium]|nr:polyphosphate polymerase domain-containing protein [Lachnospiraceae bacterium]
MLSVLRSELKYWISYRDSLLLQAELDKLLMPDEYSQDGFYRVRSLYFDSINQIDFTEKLDGVESRKKIRMRIYDEDTQTVKLECKQKTGALQHKESLLITRAEAMQYMEGDYSGLLERPEETAWRLYSDMTLGGYRPAVIIEYDRCAYLYGEYNTRITIDRNVRSSELCLDLFEREIPWIPTIDNQVILEVKFNEKLIEPIKRILAKYHLTNVSVSKYGSGRPILEQYIV